MPDVKIKKGFPWWMRAFVQRGVVGITIGRRIYLSPELNEERFRRYLRHELAHVRQYEELGIVRFLWRYLTEYVRLRRGGLSPNAAYAAISFEREAVAAEEEETV